MKTLYIICACVIGCVLAGQEISIKNPRTSIFDAAGHLTRRIIADSATGPFDMPTMKNGRVEFFTEENPLEALATLSFNDAVYRRLIGVVESDGQACLRSMRGSLSGDGFRYTLSDGHLVLKSNVECLLGTVRIEGKQGDIFVSPDSLTQNWGVTKAVIDGRVVVTGISDGTVKVDRAETSSTIYTAFDDTLVLAAPVTCWRGGEKMIVGSDDIRILNVSNKSKRAREPMGPGDTPRSEEMPLAVPLGNAARLQR